MIRRSGGERAFDFFNVALMVFIILLMLFPMWHAVNVSLSSGAETLKGGIFL